MSNNIDNGTSFGGAVLESMLGTGLKGSWRFGTGSNAGALHIQTLGVSSLTTATLEPDNREAWENANGLIYLANEGTEASPDYYYYMYIKFHITHKYVIGALMGQTALAGHTLQPYAYMNDNDFYLLRYTSYGTAGKWIPLETYEDDDGNPITELPNGNLIRTGGASNTQHTFFSGNAFSTGHNNYDLILRLRVAKDVYDEDAENYENPVMTFGYMYADKAIQEYGEIFSNAQGGTQHLVKLAATTSVPNVITSVSEDGRISTYYEVGNEVTRSYTFATGAKSVASTGWISAWDVSVAWGTTSIPTANLTVTFNGVTYAADSSKTIVVDDVTYATEVGYRWYQYSGTSASVTASVSGFSCSSSYRSLSTTGTVTYSIPTTSINVLSIDSSFAQSVTYTASGRSGSAIIKIYNATGEGVPSRNISETYTRSTSVSTTPVAADSSAAYELDSVSDDENVITELQDTYDFWYDQVTGAKLNNIYVITEDTAT